MTTPVDMQPPLHGIRVVDLTRVLSGPFCSMLLGDMGAEVIKIESPSGDPVRGQGHHKNGFSWYFAGFNRNKKSVVLDLYSDEGRADLARLIKTADVLVENFRPGVLAKMGFSQERLDELNPRLVVASVNGFGSKGPYTDRPAFDFIAQAMSGFMSVNGPEGEAPLRAAQPVTDLVAGLYTAFGVVSALHGRNRDGRGQAVETSMVNGVLSMMAYLASEHFVTGENPQRTGNDHPLVAPYGLYDTADGQIAIAPSNDQVLQRLLTEIGLAELLEDPRFDSNAKRFERRDELHGILDAALASDTQENWIIRLNRAGVPTGKIQTLKDVFEDPQIKAQEMSIDVPHGDRGDVRMLGFPVKLSRTPCEVRLPAPELGEHTEEVLSALRDG
ncbi:CaiB/BaiF CoA transferase family protein [Tritonibacter mobilis]|uniref:CaiB/BaiF CoA transferase family protein n=1 Tax=Tritonibacter mobilis TaxID=379347 RepID=UPI001403E392|nr:CoA transferase [Tritonibacter mobilis]MBU3033919.1 CoA transferase [Tritonibacter mobilis]NHM19407.1 CoA transferase [Tritonibacter mobilis]NHM23557.1 CoA transferase [Tritonibacter mobilis]WHQ84970.1 CoA transferase [Tritonibacter mobilis]